MSKKDRNESEINGKNKAGNPENWRLHPDTKKSIFGVVFIGLALILILAWLGKAGPVGNLIFNALDYLFGVGYFSLPLILFLMAGVFLISGRQKIFGITFIGAGGLILSILGLIDILFSGQGGILGKVFGSLKTPFNQGGALIINLMILTASFLTIINLPIRLGAFLKNKFGKETGREKLIITGEGEEKIESKKEKKPGDKTDEPPAESDKKEIAEEKIDAAAVKKPKTIPARNFKNYVPPPLSLLKSTIEKPTTGDLRANANIIKRTLESFGVPVEMGEVNIGPKVTRYTLKPAEGVKLSRITALNQDLSLALAAHPIRIEAPIPGKSLVGIEVPNRAAALVRLGSLLAYPEFQKAGFLTFSLGRDVNGEPIFTDIDRMPHLLIAGATGSGKSILIHSLLISLLYKNSPETLRLILIDPKRVELSIYEGLPHLISPVITENKKAFGVFRWAINEMERRYDLLLKAGRRDIQSYNQNGDEILPYILIVVDELADLMTSYGREIEGSVVRLAQMARATGLHLIFSTQRPSVEIITGLIKANITSRIALQVASQIDSRTILDMSGAEKLLGGGDLLHISSELSKPKRIQAAYISEEEIQAVADFIRDHNQNLDLENIELNNSAAAETQPDFDEYLDEEGDELYDEAIRVVAEAKKASASLLQRRLKVGYARAARLLDLMENNELIGPGEGAKPREVFLEKIRAKENNYLGQNPL